MEVVVLMGYSKVALQLLELQIKVMVVEVDMPLELELVVEVVLVVLGRLTLVKMEELVGPV